jgi:1-phosphofructokinase family hexose kinase
LGYDVLATAPLAGRAGQIVADLALAEGIAADWFWLSAGETRTCLLINHDDGDTTVINEQGPVISAADWQAFAAHVKRLAQKAGAVAFSGSLPLGVDPAVLGEVAGTLAAAGQTVYVDTSGPALAALLAHPAGLCIKVNQSELTAGLGLTGPEHTIAALVKAGRQLLARGAALVVITLGHKGALALAPDRAWQIEAPAVQVVSTVGSGDSLLAGLAVARLQGRPLDAALAFSVACGSANALNDLPARFKPGQVEMLLKKVRLLQL